jgi:hypothetical protein
VIARHGFGLDSNFYLAATFLTVSPLPLRNPDKLRRLAPGAEDRPV